MKKKRIFSILFLAVFVFIDVLFYPSCKKQESKQVELIKIGAILPLTGNFAIIGQPEKQAIEIYQECNPKFDIKVYWGDFAGNASNVVTRFKEIESKFDPNVYIASTSVACNVLRPYIQNTNNVMFANSSQPNITDGENVFRIAPNTEQELLVISENIFKNYKNIFIIRPNNELGIEIEKNLKKFNATKQLFFETYDLGSKDFKNLIFKISKEIDLVVFEGYPAEIPIFLKQFSDYNKEIKKIVLSMAALWLPTEMFKSSNLNVDFPAPFFYLGLIKEGNITKSKKINELILKYENKFKTKINYDVLYIWEVLNCIEEIYANNKGTILKNEQVKKYWKERKEIKGLTGNIKLIEKGDCFLELGLYSTLLQ